MTKKKQSHPDPDPVVTEADLATIQLSRALQAKLQALYALPCSHCGAKTTMRRLATQIGINETVLWRFIQGKQVTLMEDNLKRIQGWVEQAEKSS